MSNELTDGVETQVDAGRRIYAALSRKPNRREGVRYALRLFARVASLSLRRLLKIELTVGAVTAIAITAALCIYFLMPTDPLILDRFLPEAIKGTNIIDSGPQRRAYQVFFAVLVFGAIVIALLPATQRPLVRLTPVFVIVIFVIMLVHGPAEGSWAAWFYLAGILAVLLAGQLAWQSRLRWVVWVLTGVIFALAIGPSVFGTFVPNPLALVALDHHYNFMFSQTRQLTAGYLLSGDVAGYPPGYGLLSQLLIGIAVELGQPISFAGLIRIVQFGQAAFFLLLLSAVWLRVRNAPAEGLVFGLFLTALLAAPWLYTLGGGAVAPNLSGFRSLMFVVVAVIAGLLRWAGPITSGALVGATTGIALLFNLETGIVSTAGLGIAWLLRVRGEALRIAFLSTVSGITALLAVMILFGALYWAFSGKTAYPSNVLFLFDNIRLFASGYIGLPLKFQFIVIVIMLHAGSVLIRTVRSILNHRYPAPDLMDAAVATMVLAWLPYYVNRPVNWNFFAILTLYILLLIPAVAARGRRLAAVMIVVLLVLPTPMRTWKENLTESVRRGWAPGWVIGWQYGCADGLLLPEDQCDRLRQRAETLRRFSNEGTVFWASSMSLLMRHMSGVRTLLWTGDLVPQLFTPEDLTRVAAKVESIKPHMLLLDDPSTPLQERLAGLLSRNYCPDGVIGGWRIYRRDDTCSDGQNFIQR